MELYGRLNIYDDANVAFGVRPVVTLKPNIKAVGKDINGAWDIEMKRALEAPIAVTKLYKETEQLLEFENFDTSLVNITGTTSATEPGIYTATISLKEPGVYMWLDGTSDDIDISWKIIDTKVDIYNTTYSGITPRNEVKTDTSFGFTFVGLTSNFEKVNIPIVNLEIGKTYTLGFTESSTGNFYSNDTVRNYGCNINDSRNTNTSAKITNLSWKQEYSGNNRNGVIIFKATATTMYWSWDMSTLVDGETGTFLFENITIDLIKDTPRIDNANYTTYGGTIYSKEITNSSLNFSISGTNGIYEKINIPIINLDVGKEYTLKFTESSSGATPYTSAGIRLYGCKVTGEKDNDTSKMFSNPDWKQETLGIDRSGSITFTATATTMYWNWELSQLMDNSYTTVILKDVSVSKNT